MVERRNNLSLTSPAPEAVPVPPTATDAAAVATTATLPSYATVTIGSYCAGTDKAMEAETTTTPANPQTMRSQVTAIATRASERLSVVTKRINIPQLEGGFSPSDSSFEAFSQAPEPTPGYILCNICRTHHHVWVYSQCKHCKV
jgi:hypothetical protein